VSARQTHAPPRVAFQGARGAFSEEAALELLGPDIALVPRATFEALFAAVDEGGADCALAPVENSLAGSVHRSYDLLLDSALHITGEVVIPIRHYLIGCPGASFEQLKTVESHPVALAQCEQFFAAHTTLRRIATEDTAGSVAQVISDGDPTRAAIAGRHAAELYGGQILRARLEDHRENYTRFVLLTPSAEVADGADKLSLVMKLPHRPGALHQALEPFARRGIDLLKIESRPVRGRPWQYHFYLDLRAALPDAGVAAALEELRARATGVRVLGCYPSARAVAGGNLVRAVEER
jgi:prephenate dehydratase